MAKTTVYDIRGIGGLGEGSQVELTLELRHAPEETTMIVATMDMTANMCEQYKRISESLKLTADKELGTVEDTHENRHLLGRLAAAAAYDAVRGPHDNYGNPKRFEKERCELEKILDGYLKTETGVTPNNYNSRRG